MGDVTRREFVGGAGCFLAFVASRRWLFGGAERYVATCRSVGYGWGWDDWEAEDLGSIPDMPAGEADCLQLRSLTFCWRM